MPHLNCASLCCRYASFYLTRNSLAFTAPTMLEDKALGLDMTAVGGLTSILPVAYGFSKFLSGVLGARTSPRILLAGRPTSWWPLSLIPYQTGIHTFAYLMSVPCMPASFSPFQHVRPLQDGLQLMQAPGRPIERQQNCTCFGTCISRLAPMLMTVESPSAASLLPEAPADSTLTT